MAGRYPGSYLDRSNGWRAAAILADIGQASLVKRIPGIDNMIFAAATPTRPALPAFAIAQRRRLPASPVGITIRTGNQGAASQPLRPMVTR
jgi:hypothetical protein